MYCSSCGTALTQELSYCNRCGAKLSITKGGGTTKSLEKSIESIMGTIAGTTITMLGIMIAVMALMIGANLGSGFIALFMALMFLMLLGIDGVFIWQLMRLNSRAKEIRNVSEAERLGTKELGSKPEQTLLGPRPSVTEEATRMFEPRYEERKTR